MARFDVFVDDTVGEQFRNTVFKEYGLHRGSLRRALTEAIALWLEKKAKLPPEQTQK
ncbi:MAG: hypothetical protein WA364_04000 [Candidatus Nitrosopolaris sp.]